MSLTASWNSFSIETHKALRILLIDAVLSVGALNVHKCTGSGPDVGQAAQDQYDRMNP